MVVLDKDILYHSSLSILLILFGSMIMNSIIHIKKSNILISYIIGSFMFILGWLYFCTVLTVDLDYFYCIWLPCALIIISTLAIAAINNKTILNLWDINFFYLLNIVSWTVLGYVLGNKLNNKCLGIAICLLNPVSMLLLLPYQRKHNICDGPALTLNTIVYGLIIFMNSLVI